MNKVFIDTDVILDVIFERNPHAKTSHLILGLAESNKIKGFTSSLVMANCYYIIESKYSKQKAKNSIQTLKSFIKILPVTGKELEESLNSKFDDFEDGIQYFVSLNNNIQIIITRNIKDYKHATCEVYSPKEYLSLLNDIT